MVQVRNDVYVTYCRNRNFLNLIVKHLSIVIMLGGEYLILEFLGEFCNIKID